MPEGLDPVEAGRKLHEHTHAEDQHTSQRAAESEAGKRRERHSRILQTGEAVLLALVTIAAAWAGYAAARWGTSSRLEIAQSSSLRNLATRADLEAQTVRTYDASTFNAWFIAFVANKPKMEALAQRRMRPDYQVAFQAWLATDPLHNPRAPLGPSYMPEYKIPQQARANALDRSATAKFDQGNHDGEIGDNYIRITVFLAAVLFLVGIGSTFKLHQIRYALIAFGTALLILATVLIIQEPGLPH